MFAGATGALGRCAVRAMAEGGMNVVMVTHNPDSAKEIIEETENYPGTVIALSNENGDGAVFGDVEKRFGSVDVVINTTGALDAIKPISEVTENELNEKLAHQVTNPFLMMQAAIPYLKKSKAGRILFLTSAGATDGFTGENLADSIARGGVISMTKGMARLLAGDGITVNAIARSGMINDHEPEKDTDFDVKTIIGRIPIGRAGKGEEFGSLVAYLAGEESAFLTGQVFHLSGGLHI